jgi:two-component system, NarL family, sensor histidine kinase UhpB
MKSVPSPGSHGPRRGSATALSALSAPSDGDEQYRARLNTALEWQARAIGQSLHDEAGQLLAAAFLALEEAARDLPTPARQRLFVVKTHLAAVEEQLRHVAQELHPRVLAEGGVVAALQFLARGFETRHGIVTSVSARVPPRLPQPIATAVYRMAQEGLTNIGRHARARRASISVAQKSGALWCTIRDDGVGFDPAAVDRRGGMGLGLQGIRGRLSTLGGALVIKSGCGDGTRLIAAIPLKR